MVINQAPDAVFIHVTDMDRAIRWYSQRLDVPMRAASHRGLFFALPLDSPTNIILDAHPKAASARGTGPRVMFTAADIVDAHSHANPLSHAVTDFQDIGSSVVFCLEDPDGNLICIRQPKVTTPDSRSMSRRQQMSPDSGSGPIACTQLLPIEEITRPVRSAWPYRTFGCSSCQQNLRR